MPPGVSALCEAGLATSQDMPESCWSWTEGAGWILPIPLMQIFCRWKYIIHRSYYEADVAFFHLPLLTPVDLSPLKAFPLHPLPLFSKRDSLRASRSLLLPAHFIDHQLPPLRWCCLAPRWFAPCQTRPKPPLPSWVCPIMSWCLRADLACSTASDGVHFRPVSTGGAALLTVWSFESCSVICILTETCDGQLQDPFAVESSAA